MKITNLFFAVVALAFGLAGCDEKADEIEEFDYYCEDVGGECTGTKSTICAKGFEPYTDRDWLKSNCHGHCCVVAPDSACGEADGNFNCVPGENCDGNYWKAVEGNVSCESGRSCCYWSGK